MFGYTHFRFPLCYSIGLQFWKQFRANLAWKTSKQTWLPKTKPLFIRTEIFHLSLKIDSGCDSSVKYNSTYDSSQKQFPRIKRREKKLLEGSVARLQNYKMVRTVFDLEMDWFFFRLKTFLGLRIFLLLQIFETLYWFLSFHHLVSSYLNSLYTTSILTNNFLSVIQPQR